MQQNLQILSYPIKKEHKNLLIVLFLIIITSIAGYNVLIQLQPGPLFNINFLPQFLPKSIPGKKSNYCDYSDGKWVYEETHARKGYSENCPFLDPGFRCQNNGRKDLDYQKWRWQPKHCNLPRFDAKDFLERARNQRIVFAGDSIARNQWESLICMLVIIDRPPPNVPKEVYGVIRVDRLHWFSSNWVGADVLVFSAGHWWNLE